MEVKQSENRNSENVTWKNLQKYLFIYLFLMLSVNCTYLIGLLMMNFRWKSKEAWSNEIKHRLDWDKAVSSHGLFFILP